MIMIKNRVMENIKNQKYIEALEKEQKKIQVFQRELPLCFELVTNAIESCRKKLLSDQSECSERTTSEFGRVAVLEEFIPIKLSSSSSSSLLSEDNNNNNNKDGAEKINVDNKKLGWLQLWNPSPAPQPKQGQAVVEMKRNGAFQPFQKTKIVVPAAKVVISPTSSSTAESGGGRREEKQSLSNRKERRCWSPELHRRFLHALHQLGGSHVATPKQIRDLMKVDGLTNDEVKSHLQKYRLHTKRPAASVVSSNGGENDQLPEFMVVEGVWAPSQEVSNNRVYTQVVLQPTGERSSSGRCKSPAMSTSTHTQHILHMT